MPEPADDGPIEIVLATRNRHKVEEIAAVLDLPGTEILGLERYPGLGEIVEDGSTFEENAEIKAMAVASHTGRLALGDDSGLVVDALDGRPGVHSARYSGPNATDRSNRVKLLEEMRGVSARTARFVCVLCLTMPNGHMVKVEGRCEGEILDEERGTGGFGYDPLFRPEGHSRTFAEMAPEEKNSLSHRGRALAEAAEAFPPLVRYWRAVLRGGFL